MSNFQGASGVTIYKQQHLHGQIYMQTLRRKNKRPSIICDVFCGTGENRINEETIINGSPVTIMGAVSKAVEKNALYIPKMIFSDIRQEALTQLSELIPENIKDKVHLSNIEAQDQIRLLHRFLINNPDYEAIIIADPNGPKDFPFDALLEIGNDKRLTKRLDIIAHISATAIKRCTGSVKQGYKFDEWIEQLNDFKHLIEQISGGRDGWIRQQLGSDAWQWTIISLFGWPPKNDWKKQGFVRISSEQGQSLMNFYSTTKKAAV